MSKNLVAPRGDYKNLLTYRKAELIFDLTFYFCHHFLDLRDRTIDQMVQAARSGKQNIAEGSASGLASREAELKLTCVAKASFQELLTDYEDFLRVRNMKQWSADSLEVKFIEEKTIEKGITNQWFLDLAKTRPPETIANMAICFLHQEDYLLQKQLESLEKKFLTHGGFRENMRTARQKEKNKMPSTPSTPSTPSNPSKSEQAKALFHRGANCAQAVLGAFASECGLTEETAFRIASGFGGGIGRMREVCGAVSGMVLTANFLCGQSDISDKSAKDAHYARIRILTDAFRKNTGSVVCRTLLGLDKEQVDQTVSEERTQQYYKKRPCAELVALAAEILEKEFLTLQEATEQEA